MGHYEYQIRQLADEIQSPESGKQSIVLTDDDNLAGADRTLLRLRYEPGSALEYRFSPCLNVG
jgi:hypothetical protein